MVRRPKFMMPLSIAGTAIAVSLTACGTAGPSTSYPPENQPVSAATQAATESASTAIESPATDGSGATASSSPSANPGPASASPADDPGTDSPSGDTGSGSSAPSAGDFELDLPFTSFQSSNAVTEAEEENAFQHVLFYVDPSGATQSQVIDGNLTGTPVPATVTANSDGSLTIVYSEQTSSATVDFNGTLSGSTMQATVTVSQMGGDVVDGTEYIGAGTGTVTFTTTINPVSDSSVPQAPGGGECGYSSDYGVELSWTPPPGGASAYDLFAVINTSAEDVVYQGQVSQPGADDESELAKENDGGTMSYEIYSVSSAGVQSLTPLYVTLTGLPGATAPICSYSG
jgi:predicted small lipoprotein YifL